MGSIEIAKTSVVAMIGVWMVLVAITNVFDYGTNFAFVQHVMSMDTTFGRPGVMWRAIGSTPLHHAAYITIIMWELVGGLLCLGGAVMLARAIGRTPREFDEAKTVAVAGLAVAVALWTVAFLIVGGEWFVMWQSAQWNGQQAAFRSSVMTLIALVWLAQRDS